MPPSEELKREQTHLTAIQSHIERAIEAARSGIRQSHDHTQIVINTVMQNQSIQLERSRDQPYFSRISCREHGRRATEDFYIGRFGLFDRETLAPYVIDWRSPIANLYYDESFADVPVQVDRDHELRFDVHRKRHFELRDGKLVQFFDSTSAVRADQPLMQRLNAKSEQRMKDIVETIQADQNRVIRADPNQLLIVQGVAGSGKTTIALHRLSYLAYQQKGRTTFGNFLVIAPNRLFIDYISDVLPNLGVEGVTQTTWEDLLLLMLPKRVRLQNHQKKVQLFIEGAAPAASFGKDTVARAALLRSHMAMKELLDRYVEHLLVQAIPDEDLVLDTRHVMSREQIAQKFHRDFAHYPYIRRRERLIAALRAWSADALAEVSGQIAKRFAGRYLEADAHTQAVKQSYEKALDHYCAKIRAVDIFASYRMLITTKKSIVWLIKRSGNSDWLADADNVASCLKHTLTDRAFEWEDIAGLFYLTYRLHGLDKRRPFSHIIVDEAQDLGPFQIYLLRLLCNQDSISVFGDLSQSIYAFKGLGDWRAIPADLFAKPPQVETLPRSYRSTVEIMSLANEVLAHWKNPDKVLAEPVLRHGETPKRVRVSDERAAVQQLADDLNILHEAGMRNIAIIDKSLARCRVLGNMLTSRGERIKVITDKETRYEGGVSVVSVYFAKGMEFDAVILINPTEQKFDSHNAVDIKLLYVAMTRALHRLYIYHWDPLASLIPPQSVYLDTSSTC